MGCRSSRVLRDRVWTRPGRVGAACDAWVLGLLGAHVRGCMNARLCRDQGEGWVGKRGEPWIIMGGRVVQTTRRRCRPERRVNHVARRPNERDVEKVQPAAFTCGRKVGLPAGMAPPLYSAKSKPYGSHRIRELYVFEVGHHISLHMLSGRGLGWYIMHVCTFDSATPSVTRTTAFDGDVVVAPRSPARQGRLTA